MSAVPKMVMQVTITPEECPDLHRELSGITSARRRVKRFLKLADLGLLVEQGRVAASGLRQRGTSGAQTSMPLKPLTLTGANAPSPTVTPLGGQSIAEMADMFEGSNAGQDVDEPD